MQRKTCRCFSSDSNKILFKLNCVRRPDIIMKKTILIIFCIVVARKTFGQTLIGTYVCQGKSKVKFTADSYEQKITDCTIVFTTKGTYKIIRDTLTLFPVTIYNDLDKKRTRKPITDTSNYISVQAKLMTKYLVRADTLVQLKYFSKELNSTWTLVKQK